MKEVWIEAIAYFLFPILAIIGMVAAKFTREKDLFRIDFGALAQFMAFIVMLTIFRVLKIDMLIDMGLMHGIPQIPEGIDAHRWTLGLVFWEDMFFAVPMYLMQKYMTKRKWLRRSLILLLSVLFGMGHAYEGWQAMLILAFAPYCITLQYGKKYGFGTTMCAHILYDFATTYYVVMLPYLLS